MIDMPSLKSVTIGASSFHDGNALNMTGNGSDCLSWCRFTTFGIPSPWRLCFQYRKDSCVCELVMLRSVIQRLVKIAVNNGWWRVVPWLCQCSVWKLALASECYPKTCLDCSQRCLVWSRSVVVSMRCLRVGFCFKVSHKDLPRLQSATFGVESFRDCISIVFESSFIVHMWGADLPEVKSIELGWNAFRFERDNDRTSLIMRSICCSV